MYRIVLAESVRTKEVVFSLEASEAKLLTPELINEFRSVVTNCITGGYLGLLKGILGARPARKLSGPKEFRERVLVPDVSAFNGDGFTMEVFDVVYLRRALAHVVRMSS
jgi:hypothetical protein